MYSEFDEISLMSMSNNSERLLSEKDQSMIKFELLLRRPSCKLEFPERSLKDDEQLHQRQEEIKVTRKEEDDDEEEEEKKECKASLGEMKAEASIIDDEDDGFRTPTSLYHKIPVARQCPPAPRKSKSLPSSTKRKSLSSKRKSHLRIDLTEEIELLFPPAVITDLGRKIKKVRGDDNK